MSYVKTLCDCENIRDLTFLISGKERTGLADVSFVVAQDFITGSTKDGSYCVVPSYRTTNGILYPKNAECASKLLEQIVNGTFFSIEGWFKDRRSGNESRFALKDVLIQNASAGSSSGWSFHANSVKRL